MALLFCDGFDHYNAEQGGGKWDHFGALIKPNGRRANGANLEPGGRMLKFLPSSTTLIVGFAVRGTGDDASGGIQLDFGDGQSSRGHGLLQMFNLGLVRYFDGSLKERGANRFTPQSQEFQYLECKVRFSHFSGVLARRLSGLVEVRINGIRILRITDVNTRSRNTAAGAIVLHASSCATVIDDLYVCNDTGGVNDDFLGDIDVQLVRPQRVRKVAHIPFGEDADQEYSIGRTPLLDSRQFEGDPKGSSTFALEPAKTKSRILGAQVIAAVRKDGPGSRNVSLGLGNGTTEAYGAAFELSEEYKTYAQPFDVDPINGAGWASDSFKKREAAIRVTS